MKKLIILIIIIVVAFGIFELGYNMAKRAHVANCKSIVKKKDKKIAFLNDKVARREAQLAHKRAQYDELIGIASQWEVKLVEIGYLPTKEEYEAQQKAAAAEAEKATKTAESADGEQSSEEAGKPVADEKTSEADGDMTKQK